MLNIEEIKAREQVATKGPWVVRENKSFGIQSENKNIASCFKRENENFIAHARQDIPDLIAEVERLQEANKNLESHFREVQGANYAYAKRNAVLKKALELACADTTNGWLVKNSEDYIQRAQEVEQDG